MSEIAFIEEVAFTIFLMCLLIYTILFLNSLTTKRPSQRAVLNEIYRNWVSNQLNNQDTIVSVQAIRNFIMANSTFISALFILLSMLIGIYDVFFVNNAPFWGNEHLTLGLVKITLNIFIIVFALYNFIVSIRMLSRLTILITGNPQDYSMGDGKIKGKEITKKTFVLAQNHWMFGIRSLFYLAATLVWYLDAILFIIMSILVTIYLIVFQDTWLFSRQKAQD